MQQTARLCFEPIYPEQDQHKKLQQEIPAETKLRKLFEKKISELEKEKSECLAVICEQQKREIEQLSGEKVLLIACNKTKEREIIDLSDFLEVMQKLWEEQVTSLAVKNHELDLASKQKIADLANTIEDLQRDRAKTAKLFKQQVNYLDHEKTKLGILLEQSQAKGIAKKKKTELASTIQGLQENNAKIKKVLEESIPKNQKINDLTEQDLLVLSKVALDLFTNLKKKFKSGMDGWMPSVSTTPVPNK